MLVTIDMLLEALPSARFLMGSKSTLPRFSSVLFDGSKQFDICEGEDQCLFVGSAEQCEGLDTGVFAGWVLCLVHGEAPLPPKMTSDGRMRILVVDAGAPVGEARMLLAIRYGELAAWQCRLKQVMLDGGRYQELLDASEFELGNHIHITDQNLQIVARTKNLQPDPRERYTVEASKTGYFSEEAVNVFRKAGRPKKWNAQHGIRLEKSVLLSAAQYYDYYFHSQGYVRMHLIMHTNLVPPSNASRDKLQILIDHLRACMFNDIAAGMNLNMGAAKVLADLASGNAVANDVLEEEFERALFPTEGPYRLLVFDFGLAGGEGQLASYNAIRLGGLFDGVLVAVHDERVLFLAPEREYAKTGFTAGLESYVKRHACKAGISDSFFAHQDARFALQQCLIALSFVDVAGESVSLTAFHDVFCLWLLASQDHPNDLLAYCARNSIPARILRDDENGGPESYELLIVFLEEERRATAAAGRLHIHRTTLLYQVKRLEKVFGFCLDDRLTRERIGAEIKCLEFDVRWKDSGFLGR